MSAVAAEASYELTSERFPADPATKPEREARFRRTGIRIMIWVALSAALVYFLFPQLGELRASLRSLDAVHLGWVLIGGALVALRYVLATLSLQQAVGQPLPFRPTLLVQMSSAFVGRLTPEGVGWLVLNQRYLERAGLGRASALAAITLKLLAGGIARLVITLLIAALVGTSGLFSVDLPVRWPYLIAILAGLLVIGLVLRRVFRASVTRWMAPVLSGARDLATVVRQPARAMRLFGSSAGLTISYGLVLAASVQAFGAEASVLEVLAVYLGGTAVASASPTPGNLGAVEVALSAGLTAVGVPSGAAVGAVLLYRLLTFWLPVVPGFIAFHALQRQHRI